MKWNWNKVRTNIQHSNLGDLFTLSDIVKNELKKRDMFLVISEECVGCSHPFDCETCEIYKKHKLKEKDKMSLDKGLEKILKQFLQTKDIKQAIEDIKILLEI